MKYILILIRIDKIDINYVYNINILGMFLIIFNFRLKIMFFNLQYKYLPDGPKDGPCPGSPAEELADPAISPVNAGGRYADIM